MTHCLLLLWCFQVLRLVNDSSHTCRKRVADTLRTLFRAMHRGGARDRVSAIMTIVLGWLQGQDTPAAQAALLQRAAAQLCGIVACALGRDFQGHAKRVLATLVPLIHTAADAFRHPSEDADITNTNGEFTDSQWASTYSNLVCVEKLLAEVSTVTVKALSADDRQVFSPCRVRTLLIARVTAVGRCHCVAAPPTPVGSKRR